MSLSTQEQNSVTATNSISQPPSQSLDFNTSNPERRETTERNSNDPMAVALPENSVTEDEEMSDEGLTFPSAKDLATRDTSSNKEENLDSSTSTTMPMATTTDKPWAGPFLNFSSYFLALNSHCSRKVSQNQLSKDFNVHRGTIAGWKRKLAPATDKKQFKDLTDEDKEKIRQDTKKGKFQREMAKDFGVKRGAISRWQKKLGVVSPLSTGGSNDNEEEVEEAPFSEDCDSEFEESVRESGDSSPSSSIVGKKRKREEEQEDLEPPAKKQKKSASKASKKRKGRQADLENNEEGANEGSSPHNNSDDQENTEPETLSELSTIKKPARPIHHLG